MGFKRIKERIKCNPNFNIVYQMFKSPDSLEFIEDLDKRVPLHKDTLKGDVNLINLNKMAEENKYKVLEDNNSIFDEEFNIIDYKNNIKTNNVNRIYCKEYMFRFTAGPNCAINLPDTVKFNGGLAPTFIAGRTYEYNIVDNLAVVGEFF